MSNAMFIEPSNQNFAELLSNGVRYSVPRFQRDYSWEQEQWEDLWTDVEGLEQESHHYMGYIVLQRKSQGDFDIVDGQQRLTTLSLLVLAAMKRIQDLIDSDREASQNKERLQAIGDRFIGSKDIISLRVDNKLTLNRNNAVFYREICARLSPPKQRGMTKTNRLLQKAFDFFAERIQATSGEQLAAFINRFSLAMVFTRIVVQDSVNAYKVFETLNARGIQLSTPDLIKNYLFSVVTQDNSISEEHLNELDERWGVIIQQLGEHNFSNFMRYYHLSHHAFVTKKELFKALREYYKDARAAYHYLASLKDTAPIYAALAMPNDDWWSADASYREAKHYLEGLSIFNIKQPFAILMVAYQHFSPEEFIKVLRYIYVLAIRYNVICSFSPNEQEKRYSRIAINISQGRYKRASHVKNSQDFQDLYPKDDEFKSYFSYKQMLSRRSPKKIRFLLADIENYLGASIDHLDVVLEHILPYNPSQDWHESFGAGVQESVDRLGNMLLLKKDDLKQAHFSEKQRCYQDSSFRIAQKVATYDDWDAARLNRHQTWLAEQACKTWTI